MSVSILWFRRDLRLRDHPALHAAAANSSEVVPLFVLDPRLRRAAGPSRLAFLADCLRELDADLGGNLVLLSGKPDLVVPRIARELDADAVHITADYGPYGIDRDARVEKALTVPLIRTGSPYAIAPGEIIKPNGEPYRVFTPFSRVWLNCEIPAPIRQRRPRWISLPSLGKGIPKSTVPSGLTFPTGGERAALRQWKRFKDRALSDYDSLRDRPDADATSGLSPYLRWGCVHPRTLLADLADFSGAGPEEFRRQLIWREFYADLLFHHPVIARANMLTRFDEMPWNNGRSADDLFNAWAAGLTGYPIVDAGMRQLRHEGWMHNRVRLIVASFLVKDLHLDWRRGARHFMHWLVDGDLASNQLNWQWVAGTLTGAAPFHRVFSPVRQGEKFDPDGDYVRRYVPELRAISGKAVHTPWELPDGPPNGYPDPVVDHEIARAESLRRYRSLR